jgi:hypothetical protein
MSGAFSSHPCLHYFLRIPRPSAVPTSYDCAHWERAAEIKPDDCQSVNRACFVQGKLEHMARSLPARRGALDEAVDARAEIVRIEKYSSQSSLTTVVEVFAPRFRSRQYGDSPRSAETQRIVRGGPLAGRLSRFLIFGNFGDRIGRNQRAMREQMRQYRFSHSSHRISAAVRRGDRHPLSWNASTVYSNEPDEWLRR